VSVFTKCIFDVKVTMNYISLRQLNVKFILIGDMYLQLHTRSLVHLNVSIHTTGQL